MKKIFMGIGIVGILFLMVSSATAVPTAHSEPLMKQIEKVEHFESLLDSNIAINSPETNGIIDILIQLITVIIQLVMEIISIVQGVLCIIGLIQALINAIQVLFELIPQLIEIIQNLFNPTPEMV